MQRAKMQKQGSGRERRAPRKGLQSAQSRTSRPDTVRRALSRRVKRAQYLARMDGSGSFHAREIGSCVDVEHDTGIVGIDQTNGIAMTCDNRAGAAVTR